MTLGSKIQKLRKEKGMSQEHLAAEIGVSRQAVSKWELEESSPDTARIVAISKLFNVSTDYLLGNDMDKRKEMSASVKMPLSSKFTFIENLIKERGYLAGYFISGYAFILLIMTRIANYIFGQMIKPPEGFGVTMADLPLPMKLPLYITNGISIIALILIVGGIVFSLYFKNKK